MKQVPLILCMTLASLVMSGCWFKKKPQAKAPPPPAPAAVSSPAPRATQTNRPSTTATKKPVAKRKQVPSTPRAAQSAAPPRTAEVKKEVPPAKTETPQQFGKILSADEEVQYRAMYERSSSAAREMLKGLDARELADDTMASMGRIRSFLAQAQEAARIDLSVAAQLAYRAEILARDLVRMVP